MPRANRRRHEQVPLDMDRLRAGIPQRETFGGSEWLVRRLDGGSSERSYRCPGCQQTIPPGTPHVVAWPADGAGGLDDRRHWHTSCWAARDRRRPRGAVR